jgi:predicted acyl esterase
MDDGVTLNATIGYPTDLTTGARAAGKFPVLIDQTPYRDSIVPFFVQRGYIFVTVRSRGAGTSGGQFGYVSARDHKDGVASVLWAANELDGSNGIVGGYGCSWDGETQMYSAANIGPNSPLKAIIPACAGWDYIRETFITGGILTANYPFLRTAAAAVGNQPSAQAFFQALTAEIDSGGDAAYNREFWQSRNPIVHAEKIVANGIPTLLYTGWNDVVIRGALEFYATQQNAYRHQSPVLGPMRKNQPATGRYQIIVGPWGHGQGLDPTLMLAWYDTWLKGKKTGIEKTRKPMHLYELASNRWVNTDVYPVVPDYTTYYLSSAAALTPKRPPSTAGSDTIRWTQPDQAGGALSYTTPALENGATLAGPSSVEVYASSSNTNLELIATLFDVAPDGTENRITFGAVLGSQSALDPARNWYDRRGTLIRPYTTQYADEYLSPGQTRLFAIPLHPRLWSVAPGHALRLRFTTQSLTSDCVRVYITPCALTAPAQATVPGGVYTLQRSPTRPSAVNLPLLRYRCIDTVASGVTPTSGTNTQPLDWTSGKEHDC